MPTIFSHAIAAAAAGQWLAPRSERAQRVPRRGRFWFWTVACAVLPDIDVIGFSFGVRYDDMFGHRGFTHSIVFAAAAGFVAALAVARGASTRESLAADQRRVAVAPLWAWFAAVTLSHGVLDALTDGGRGVAFLAPASNHRYFLPWRPILVSPIGPRFFSPRGFRVLASEAVWIWVPSAIIAISARLSRRGGGAAAPRRARRDEHLAERAPE